MTDPGVNRYARLGPEAQALVDDYDVIDLAVMLVAAKNDIAACRAQQWPQRLGKAEKALDRVAALAAEHPAGIDTALVLEALDQGAPAAPQPTDADTTTRVFAALHHSAEQDVTRVIDLYERWVKAGPPPLGVSLSRWWDARLIELHNAIRPSADEPARTTPNNEPPPMAS